MNTQQGTIIIVDRCAVYWTWRIFYWSTNATATRSASSCSSGSAVPRLVEPEVLLSKNFFEGKKCRGRWSSLTERSGYGTKKVIPILTRYVANFATQRPISKSCEVSCGKVESLLPPTTYLFAWFWNRPPWFETGCVASMGSLLNFFLKWMTNWLPNALKRPRLVPLSGRGHPGAAGDDGPEDGLSDGYRDANDARRQLRGCRHRHAWGQHGRGSQLDF